VASSTEALIVGYLGGLAIIAFALVKKLSRSQRLLLFLGAIGVIAMVSLPSHWPSFARRAAFVITVLLGLTCIFDGLWRRRSRR